ncbi:hypothetical protein FG386_002793 [Cryptosporidium ryanae]|uniref:uncharacterized protein n=1 Tax=Cryptosporidium ryanae TaxID=515981 RepID=UPI00351A28A7|nr:hypothetical protein FG386_002793 [Cryptosporidium ryanae]
MNSDELNFNIETVNLDAELEFETFDNKVPGLAAGVESQPFRNLGFSFDESDRFNDTHANNSKINGNDDILTRLLNSLNPVKWEFLKGHFDVTTDEIKDRIKTILKNIYMKENVIQNINAFIFNAKTNSNLGGGFGFKNFTFGGTGIGGFVNGIQATGDMDDGFELFYCRNFDKQRKSDIYGPFWLNITLAMIIGIYSTLLPQIRSKYILNPDITKFNFSFSFIFTNIIITCSSVYGLFLYSNEYTPLSLLFTIYGYGNITFFPGVFGIMFFKNNFINWTILLTCFLFNVLFLYNSLIINGNRKHTHITVMSIVIPSLIQTILLKLLFF